ncbi:MAG: hypothetical protein LLG20_18470 [Acidobacteriales bacterium]|nr:hypothetical protein [Terriglobales bacterium]
MMPTPPSADSRYVTPAYGDNPVAMRGSEPLPDEEKTARQAKEEFLRTALERWQLAADAEAEIRREALEDLEFYSGKQWPEGIMADRMKAGRPCLTINRLNQFANQIINQQRQSRPAIQVNPVDNGADPETAEILQGLTRHVELNSHADIAYDTGFMYAVIGGFGYYRILTEYVPGSFDQEILLKPIKNPFTVYYDPTCEEPDYSDAEYAFIVTHFTRAKYKRRFKDSEVAGLSNFQSIGDGEKSWFQGGNIRVAEYFWVEKVKKTLVSLTDGSSIYAEELKRLAGEGKGLPEGVDVEIRNGKPVEREDEVRIVHWCLMNAREILEERIWPGQWIPIIPVLGGELIVDGRRKLFGIVRYAKDPQRRLNFETSAMTEAIALAPKAPWIIAEGQIEGYEHLYETANIRTYSHLPYKPKSVDGQLVPPPMRQTAEPPIQAIAAARATAEADLKATTGIYDAFLGAPGPEQSGKAILARQRQGETANFNLLDNLNRAIEFTGKQLIDLEPKIYDRPGRVLQIVGIDSTRKSVAIGDPYQNKDGVMRIYDLNVGRYDVTLSVGQSYQSKRQEFVESALALVQNSPQIAPMIMDLVVRHFDWPGAAEIADRLKKMLPPNLQEGEGAEMPPEVKAKVDALMQQHEALTAELNAANEELKSKRMELESKERIAEMQAKVDLILGELKANVQSGQAMLQAEMQSIARKLDQLDAEAQRQHEIELAQQTAASAPEPTAAE